MPWAFATAAAPTGGGTPQLQAIPIDCEGHVPVAAILVGTRATSLDTHTPGATCWVAITDFTNTRLASAMSEDGNSAATTDTGVNYSNTAKAVCALAAGSETIDGEADIASPDVDEVTINWASNLPGTAVQILVFAFYGPGAQASVGSVAANTTAIDATVPVTGVPFRPKAMVQLGARTNFLQVGANSDMHLGFVAFSPDGTIQGQTGYAARDLDRPATTNSASEIRDDSTGQRITTSAEEARYEVTSGTADGFVLTTRVAAGIPYVLGYLLLDFPGLATVGTIQLPGGSTSTGDKTVPGIVGNPRAVFFIGTALSAKNALANTPPCCNWSFGLGVLGVGSASIGYASRDGAATGSTQSMTSSTRCVRVPGDTAGSDWAASLLSGTNGTFVVTVAVASPADRFLGFLAISEPSEPVVLALVLPAPQLLVTETPAAVPVALVLPQPARLLTETPNAVQVALALPQPARLVTVTPAAVQLALALPQPERLITATPAPVVLALALPQPARLLTETPAAVELALVLPAPTIVTAGTVQTPAPVALAMVVPEPVVLPRPFEVRLDLELETALVLDLEAQIVRALAVPLEVAQVLDLEALVARELALPLEVARRLDLAAVVE